MPAWIRIKLVDNLSRAKRSEVMASIRGENTSPEMAARRLLWTGGKRYRIHDKTAYGTPDISHKGKKVAVFIDGCFWHGCAMCYREPATNEEYWRGKIVRNKARSEKIDLELMSKGWNVLEVWEHEVNYAPKQAARKISDIL